MYSVSRLLGPLVRPLSFSKWDSGLDNLRESCLCTRISGVEGVLLDWVRLSLRWESCTGRADCAKQASNGGNNSILVGVLLLEERDFLLFWYGSSRLDSVQGECWMGGRSYAAFEFKL